MQRKVDCEPWVNSRREAGGSEMEQELECWEEL